MVNRMDWKTTRLNQELRKYDRKLFAHRTSIGMVHVYRLGERAADCDFDIESGPSGPPSYFLFALTEDWTRETKPLDRGIEQVMAKLRESDPWNSGTSLDEIRKMREEIRQNKQRARRNDVRALALDLRRDFARATNDINTSTLEKVENRRLKDGTL